ncbi:hypothetical protein SEET0012_10147, partial [Salmonella enterica subsp. enterica serovar Tallahassee str. 0012]
MTKRIRTLKADGKDIDTIGIPIRRRRRRFIASI